MKRNFLLLSLATLFFAQCSQKTAQKNESAQDSAKVCPIPDSKLSNGNYTAKKALEEPVVDGIGNEKIWELVPWRDIKYVWLGDEPSPQDFAGRYKILWTESRLYYLVEITDNILSDQHKDSFDNWWEDDCLELFIDEDKSGGDHQYNHDAFAYHITLDYDVVDMGPDKKPHLYNKDVETKRTKNGNVYTWEVGMKVFDKTYVDGKDNKPIKLYEGKTLGFAVSYNDNDSTGVRENFIGSVEIAPVNGDKNRGWIDAGVFGTLDLEK
jgi:Carbohydrate family 9 binding domain-like